MDASNGADPYPNELASSWRQRLHGVLDLLGPLRCGGCGAALARAASDDRRLGESLCAACERALDLDGEPARHIGRAPWPVVAPLRYAGAGERWVRRIKYPGGGLAGLDAEARGLLFALARDTAARLPRPDAIVPVPLHRGAFVRREINPALLWARALSRASGAPVWWRALVKRRPTRPQKGLGVAERRANVDGAFEAHRSAMGPLSRRPLIVLVDDVVTTGATLEACVGALRSAGLRRVGVAACIARTPSLRDEQDGHASHA